MGDLSLDVWRQILSKLDNSTLRALYMSGFEEQIRTLSSDNSFWKERAEHIAGQDLLADIPTDWKRVYYSLLDARALMTAADPGDMKTFEEYDRYEVGPHFYGLSYLPSLLVLIQVYGETRWSMDERSMNRVWRHVTDPAVMHYLLSSGLLLVGEKERYARDGLEQSAYSGREWMINPILSVIDPSRRWTATVLSLRHAISGGNLDMVKLLIGKIAGHAPGYTPDNMILNHVAKRGTREIAEYFFDMATPASWDEMMNTAVNHDNPASLSVILRRSRATREQVQALFELAVKGSPKVVTMLDELDPTLKGKTTYRSLLTATLKMNLVNRGEGKLELIRYILTKISPASANNQVLKLAVQKGDVAVVKLLLSDERLDPNIGLYEMLIASSSVVLDALVLDRRVKVEDTDERTLNLILGSQSTGIRDRIQGAEIAGRRLDLNRVLGERNDLYHLLMRFLIIKRPTGLELVDWMIERRKRQFQTAAEFLLEGRMVTDTELAPIQALMLCLLYPTASYDEVMAVLKEKRVDQSTSAQLVAAYLGEARMKSGNARSVL